MNDEDRVDLRALADATPDFDQPAMEDELRRAFRQQRAAPVPAWRVHLRWAAAAVLVLASGATAWRLTPAPGAPSALGAPAAPGAADPIGRVTDFVPLPGAAELPAFERGDIVRVELPVVSLPAYGLDMVPDAAPAYVAADLLIGQDGVPRAIRLASDQLP
jgi:hypothetical protein